jgi:hypothetical protein
MNARQLFVFPCREKCKVLKAPLGPVLTRAFDWVSEYTAVDLKPVKGADEASSFRLG